MGRCSKCQRDGDAGEFIHSKPSVDFWDEFERRFYFASSDANMIVVKVCVKTSHVELLPQNCADSGLI